MTPIKLSDLPPPESGKGGWPWTVGNPEGPILNEEVTEWPKISIITPSFNQGQFIEETIRSVLLQNYPNLEYIIIDGGSTDSTLDVIQKYDDYITLWVSESDNGQSNAINKGFLKSTGDVITWMNSDDIYFPDALNVAGHVFGSNPTVGMIYGDCCLFNEITNTVSLKMPGNFDLGHLIQENFIPQPSVFMNRNLFSDQIFLDESLHYAMDYELWLRIALQSSIRYYPRTFAQFRYHPAAKSIANAKKFNGDIVLILERLIRNPLLEEKYKKVIVSHLFWDLGIKTLSPSFRAIKIVLSHFLAETE